MTVEVNIVGPKKKDWVFLPIPTIIFGKDYRGWSIALGWLCWGIEFSF